MLARCYSACLAIARTSAVPRHRLSGNRDRRLRLSARGGGADRGRRGAPTPRRNDAPERIIFVCFDAATAAAYRARSRPDGQASEHRLPADGQLLRRYPVIRCACCRVRGRGARARLSAFCRSVLLRPKAARFSAAWRSSSARCLALRNRFRLTTDAIACLPFVHSAIGFDNGPERIVAQAAKPIDSPSAVRQFAAPAAFEHEQADRARQIAAALGVDAPPAAR